MARVIVKSAQDHTALGSSRQTNLLWSQEGGHPIIIVLATAGPLSSKFQAPNGWVKQNPNQVKVEWNAFTINNNKAHHEK